MHFFQAPYYRAAGSVDEDDVKSNTTTTLHMLSKNASENIICRSHLMHD